MIIIIIINKFWILDNSLRFKFVVICDRAIGTIIVID